MAAVWPTISLKHHEGNLISLLLSSSFPWVMLGSVVKCLTLNPRVLGSSDTGSSWFFVRVSLSKTLQSPRLALVKPRKDMNNVSCCLDMTEILLIVV